MWFGRGRLKKLRHSGIVQYHGGGERSPSSAAALDSLDHRVSLLAPIMILSFL